jgi:methionine sulfoxide reductase heme-binding subunit
VPADAAAPPRPVARSGPMLRLGVRGALIVAGLLALLIIVATDQILPPATDRQAELRLWLAARATGLVAMGLLTLQVVFGLVLSHPHNKTTWRVSSRIFPWHDHLWVFVMAFLAAHIVSLLADPKSGLDAVGALVPGLSAYRSAPVALGTLATYAFLVTAVTARWTRLLPAGMWLQLHRLALMIFVFSWLHSILAGTDSLTFEALYAAMAVAVIGAGAYRYWAARRARPTFSATHRLEGPDR